MARANADLWSIMGSKSKCRSVESHWWQEQMQTYEAPLMTRANADIWIIIGDKSKMQTYKVPLVAKANANL